MPVSHVTTVGGEVDPESTTFLDQQPRRLLIGAFLLMVALLVTDGCIGFKGSVSVRRNVAKLTEDYFRSVVLTDEVQRAQTGLGSVLYRVAAGTAAPDRTDLERQVDSIHQRLNFVFSTVRPDDPDRVLWAEVQAASLAPAADAERILSLTRPEPRDRSQMLQRRERLLSAMGSLIWANRARAEATRRRLNEITRAQLRENAALLGACLLIASLCAWLLLRSTSGLSHELHDELGQSLTALKTSLTPHSTSCADKASLSDCSDLLKASLRSAHEISRLLKPAILDDFGLESAVSWLCDRFEERPGVAVRFVSTFRGRLGPQAETHVFRIAQEALTNMARHAQATRVTVSLCEGDGHVGLIMRDDGTGITDPEGGRNRFGLIGMKARAGSLAGSLKIVSAPGKGTEFVSGFR